MPNNITALIRITLIFIIIVTSINKSANLDQYDNMNYLKSRFVSCRVIGNIK